MCIILGPSPWSTFVTRLTYGVTLRKALPTWEEESALETDPVSVGNLRDRPYSLWVALKEVLFWQGW